MNPLHLLWIIPVLVTAAFVVCGCAVAGAYDDACERDAAALMEG